MIIYTNFVKLESQMQHCKFQDQGPQACFGSGNHLLKYNHANRFFVYYAFLECVYVSVTYPAEVIKDYCHLEH